MASGLSRQSRMPDGAVAVMRKHVYIDTQMIHPALIRVAADLLGADRVMAGSDWPIVDDGPIRAPLIEAMGRAGLSDDEQRAVASGNCLRLLGVGESSIGLRAAAAAIDL
jgi:aminocarboxymuconate-semialdehyde decarboxylase